MANFFENHPHPTPPRVIVTLGPRSFDCIEALVAAGATDFRLNASHMTPDEVFQRCNDLRQKVPSIPCTIDLQGKKMRIGNVAPRSLVCGEVLAFASDVSTEEEVYVPHPELFDRVRAGERLTLDDGRIEVEVLASSATRLTTRVTRAGMLRPRKGLNRVAHPLEPEDLSLVDQKIISLCQPMEGIHFAVSFARDGSESNWVRSRAPSHRVVLKVERGEAIDDLDELARKADELWICRGDMGAQLGLSRMARRVNAVDPRRYTIPVLMAGQVLEHLTQHDTPTRSEICHLTDLVQRGYAGIVLSDETAIGAKPELATEWASNLMREALNPD